MPQIDPPLYAGGDRKIVCETLAIAAGVKPENAAGEIELPPDFPPESFYLSKDAELDWFDRNAFLERKESAKGGNNNSLTPNLNPSSNSSSQRVNNSALTLKTKTSLIAFPKSLKSGSKVESKRKQCKPVNIRFFPTKRSESALKAVAAPEPVSPKVSCIGRVRSKKKGRGSCEPVTGTAGKGRTGFYTVLFAMFRFGRSRKPVQPVKALKNAPIHEDEPVSVEPPRKSAAVSVEPAGLGGMARFKSGRRSGSWAADEIRAVCGAQ